MNLIIPICDLVLKDPLCVGFADTSPPQKGERKGKEKSFKKTSETQSSWNFLSPILHGGEVDRVARRRGGPCHTLTIKC